MPNLTRPSTLTTPATCTPLPDARAPGAPAPGTASNGRPGLTGHPGRSRGLHAALCLVVLATFVAGCGEDRDGGQAATDESPATLPGVAGTTLVDPVAPGGQAPPSEQTPPAEPTPRPVEVVPSGPAAVMEPTVLSAAAADGSWYAVGLVVNDGDGAVDVVGVEASLLAADGSVLGTATAQSPVRAVRTGESVPFEVRSTTPAAQVAAVRWSAWGGGDAEAGASRDLEVVTYWTRPAGDPQPLDMHLLREDPAGPRPFAMFGSVLGGPVDVEAPSVVFAWVGVDGRVLAVRAVPAVDSGGQAMSSLPAGGSGDFLVLVDEPLGAQLDAATVMTWTVGS